MKTWKGANHVTNTFFLSVSLENVNNLYYTVMCTGYTLNMYCLQT